VNFLAHLHLTHPHVQYSVGNYLGDFIKVNEIKNLPVEMQQGVEIHRLIDRETDAHKSTVEVRKVLHQHFGKYAGVALDIYYDYFLANHWSSFNDVLLEDFAQRQYKILEENKKWFPQKANRFFGYLVEYNILVSYRSKPGLQRVFNGMDRRASFTTGFENCIEVLEQHQHQLDDAFQQLYPSLQQAIKLRIEAFQNI